MAVSDDFLDYILDQLASWGDITARRMFGGVGLFHEGKMFGLISDDVVYLKVDESNKDKYIELDSTPFKPYKNKPTAMSYFEVPPDIVEQPEVFVEWARESLSIQKNHPKA